MSNTQHLTEKRALLDEIAMIMESLKTIAMLESQQARSAVGSQQSSLELMDKEFINFIKTYPEFSLPPKTMPTMTIIFGSERGFCGDYNARLASEIDSLTRSGELGECELVPVGFSNNCRYQNHRGQPTTLAH